MNEEQTQQLMQQVQALEAYYTELSQREAAFASILKEAAATITAIKSLNEKPASDALVPLGMGSFVPVVISPEKKIMLNIGAGVVLEKDYSSATNYLESRIKEIQVAMQDMASKKQQALAQLEQGRNQLLQAANPPSPGM